MAKQPKSHRNPGPEEQEGKKTLQKPNTLPNLVQKTITESLKAFGALSDEEKKQRGEDKEFIDKFREYFNEQHPDMLEEISNKEQLAIHLKYIEQQGFSLQTLTNQAGKIHEDISPDMTEKQAGETTLKSLQTFCNDKENQMPADLFHEFAEAYNIEEDPLNINYDATISKDKQITKFKDITKYRERFLTKKNINLKDFQKKELKKISDRTYIPTERILITTAIKKLREQLPKELRLRFDQKFHNIDMHSDLQNLNDFKQEWLDFVEEQKVNIDENLAKKLDNVVVTNGDMFKELDQEDIDVNTTGSFAAQSREFRTMFNNLVTRQVFEKVRKTSEMTDVLLQDISGTFTGFPPYLGELFTIYRPDFKEIKNTVVGFEAHTTDISQKIHEQEAIIANESLTKEEKGEARHQRKKLLEELNTYKRNAYASHIQNQDPETGGILKELIDNKFDMNALDKTNQQHLLNLLTQKKLQQVIEKDIPQMLDIDGEKLKIYINNLFDLNQKTITIKTPTQEVEIPCLEKSFLGGPLRQFPEIDQRKKISPQTFPLNLKLLLNEETKDIFEENPLFERLFDEFNGEKIAESYKVRLTNNEGKPVEGYLSQFPPKEDIKNNPDIQNIPDARYLYSHPINEPAADKQRKLITRDGTEQGAYVIIKEGEEKNYNMDILDRTLNINDKGIGQLMMNHVTAEYADKNISPEQEEEFDTKLKNMSNFDKDKHSYKDTEDKNPAPEEDSEQNAQEKKEKETQTPFQKFKQEREKLEGPQTPLIKGARLVVPFIDSLYTGRKGTRELLTITIKDINEETGEITLQRNGTETELGKSEGKTTKVQANETTFEKIRNSFGAPSKLPVETDPQKLIEILAQDTIQEANINKTFQDIKRDNGKRIGTMGEIAGQEITHFGRIESKPGEKTDQESSISQIYKVEKKGENFQITYENDKNKHSFTLDPANTILFLSKRELQPKTAGQAKGITAEGLKEKAKNNTPEAKHVSRFKGYGIANFVSMFKTMGKKLGDAMKKHEDEQSDDLTDAMMNEGKLFDMLSKIMPTDKLKTSFENVGLEYLTDRNKKAREKIDKRQKIYLADPDFGSDKLWGEKIAKYLTGEKTFKHKRQAAAMLLATIEKGKGPYSRNVHFAGKGMWIKILLGEEHQARYLGIKEKLEREVEQGKNIHAQNRIDARRDRILKFEFEYIDHCINGKQFKIGKEDTAYLEKTFSKKFGDELMTKTKDFFKQDKVAEGFTNNADASFDFARNEFFRLGPDRPQQALGFLKIMATRAGTETEWRVFESAVLAGMLSGIFHNVESSNKKYIQKMCRTRGFLLGMFSRDPYHHHKIAKLLQIASNGKFISGYDPSKRDFGNIQAKSGDKYETQKIMEAVRDRYLKDNMGKTVNDFFSFTGKRSDGKSLIQLLHDPKTPKQDKELLGQFTEKTFEKDEDGDPDVEAHGQAYEQSAFAKSQSVVEDIYRIENGDFRAKDKDAKQNIQDFWREVSKQMTNVINGNPQKEEVAFFTRKYMNRFEKIGTDEGDKQIIIKRLKCIKDDLKSPDAKKRKNAEEVLWYTIAGNVINGAGSDAVPPEYLKALDTFCDFFKKNIDTILTKEVVQESMGRACVDVLEDNKTPVKMADWEDYVDIKENTYMGAMSQEQKKARADKQKEFKTTGYINEKLYELAKKLDEKNHISNKFKEAYSQNNLGNKNTIYINPKKNPKDARIQDIQEAKVLNILTGKEVKEEEDDYYLTGTNDF